MNIKKLNEELDRILNEESNSTKFVDWYNQRYNADNEGSYIIPKQDEVTNDKGETFKIGDIVIIPNWKSKRQKFEIKAIGDDGFALRNPFTKTVTNTVKPNCIWVEKITTEKGLPIKYTSRNNVYSGSIDWVNDFKKVEN